MLAAAPAHMGANAVFRAPWPARPRPFRSSSVHHFLSRLTPVPIGAGVCVLAGSQWPIAVSNSTSALAPAHDS